MYASSKIAQDYYKVSYETLRLWANQNQIKYQTTKGGHRRYYIPEQNDNKRRSIIYARVSSYKQSEDLSRQIEKLKSKYPNHEVIQDIGSGINFKRKGLETLLESIFNYEIKEVVVASTDRLTRFGIDLFKFIFKKYQCKLKILSDKENDPIKTLSDDIISIITVFSSRYYGQRSHQNKKSKSISKQKTTN